MEKINIADLLRDCPIGMELDCSIYEDVTLYRIDTDTENEYPIRIKTENDYFLDLTKYGTYSNVEEAKCVIFPKGKTTWEGFIPPYQFKDGDIVYAIDEGNEYIFILKHIFDNGRVYCYLNLKNNDLRIQEVCLTDYNATHRLATKEEKERLFKAIENDGYKWNAETKTLEKLPKFKVGDIITFKYYDRKVAKIVEISDDEYKLDNGKTIQFQDENAYEISNEKFDITTLEPFESKVLVRNANSDKWEGDIFIRFDNNSLITNFITLGGNEWKQCIPYEENKHLLSTTDDCDDFYKTWKE